MHHGVNVRSLFRATLSNFATEGPIQGASTITMQVVKNDYMAGFERDGRYKVLQATYAVRLEKQKTKKEILERYLNTVFFGQNSYGIGAAAETYFGKSVAGARLRSRRRSWPAWCRRRRATTRSTIPSAAASGSSRCSTGWNRLDMITEAERLRIEETFVLPERVRRRAERATERTYFTEALRDYLLNRSDILGDTYEERYTRLHPRRPAHPHHARPVPPGPGRGGPQRTARQHGRDRRRARPRSTSRPGRSGRWSAARGSSPARTRSTWRSRRARPVRASSCSSSPPRCRRARPPTTSSTARIRAGCPNEGEPGRAVLRDPRRRQRWHRHAAQPHRPVDQLRVRPHCPRSSV